jgi:hypothetical protein
MTQPKKQSDFDEVYGRHLHPKDFGPEQRQALLVTQKALSEIEQRETFAEHVLQVQSSFKPEDELGPARDRDWNEWKFIFQDDEASTQLGKHLLVELRKFESLSHRLRRRREEDQRRFDRLALSLVLDAVAHYTARERGEIRVSLDANVLNQSNFYGNRELKYSARTFPVVLEALHHTEWLRVTKPETPEHRAKMKRQEKEYANIGPWYRFGEDGEAYRASTTFVAGERLKELCRTYAVGPDSVVSNYEGAEVAMMRGADAQGKPIPYKDEDFPGIADARLKVKLINAALKAAEITHFPLLPENFTGRLPRKRVDVREKTLRQVFLNSTIEDGGRLWGVGSEPCWYPLSHEYRTTALRLNGQRLVGLDFKELGIRLAYAHAGKPLSPTARPYKIPGLQPESRPAIKIITSAMTFTERMDKWTTWPEELWWDMVSGRNQLIHRDDTMPVQQFIERIQTEHVDIYDLFNTEVGYKLQRWEYTILVEAMLELIQRHQVPALPVHDCLYVGEKHVRIAQRVMEQWAKKVSGADILVEAKQ